jgi:hypothetical protein
MGRPLTGVRERPPNVGDVGEVNLDRGGDLGLVPPGVVGGDMERAVGRVYSKGSEFWWLLPSMEPL